MILRCVMFKKDSNKLQELVAGEHGLIIEFQQRSLLLYTLVFVALLATEVYSCSGNTAQDYSQVPESIITIATMMNAQGPLSMFSLRCSTQTMYLARTWEWNLAFGFRCILLSL
jgi:hypothetical protein